MSKRPGRTVILDLHAAVSAEAYWRMVLTDMYPGGHINSLSYLGLR